MNLDRLHYILRETTVQLRKGAEIEGDSNLVAAVHNFKEGEDINKLPDGTINVYAMPHESQVDNIIEKVDCHFLIIGVDKTKAESYKEELITILKDWPLETHGSPIPKLKDGPSYIHVGGVIGDQGAAFQLFALGKVLNLWDVITPETMGFTGAEASNMAGSGYIMISGFKST
ncbi:MAG: hypothetical protein AAB657_02045 [Patescibacteria group bacterium]|mgnify:CR=1 FL=1